MKTRRERFWITVADCAGEGRGGQMFFRGRRGRTAQYAVDNPHVWSALGSSKFKKSLKKAETNVPGRLSLNNDGALGVGR